MTMKFVLKVKSNVDHHSNLKHMNCHENQTIDTIDAQKSII